MGSARWKLVSLWISQTARLTTDNALRFVVCLEAGTVMALLFDDELNLRDVAANNWLAAGVAVGALFACLQKHPCRVLGLVPVGGAGLTIGIVWAACADKPDLWSCALIGASGAWINVPLAVAARGNVMALGNLADCILGAGAGIGLYVLGRCAGFAGPMQLWLVGAVAGLVTLAAWWIFRRALVEELLEFPFALMYRFRAAGPGLDTFPLKGPVIVVANHSAYLDPIWLGKVLPRSLIPMMTSYFFDQWFLRWTMIYLVGAIRVEASGFRREVPELQKAIATLDAGKCLVIFPEGRLRRTEAQPLKLFGQGVWHILKERPNTPVVICWIEGGWGSFFSYFNGPPTKNKKFDVRHPVSIAIGAPHVLSAEILADHHTTRRYLMEQCGQMRKYLGLEAIGVQQMEVAEPSEPEA